MIRSASHSSYPVDPEDARDETTAAIAVAEQSRAFLDVVTDGQVLWTGPFPRSRRISQESSWGATHPGRTRGCGTAGRSSAGTSGGRARSRSPAGVRPPRSPPSR